VPMLSQTLLDILVCPACKKPLLHRKEAGESLKCTACRRVYPVRDNIPIMLVDALCQHPETKLRWRNPTGRASGVADPTQLTATEWVYSCMRFVGWCSGSRLQLRHQNCMQRKQH
jgi:uncharacterized protein